MRQWRTLLILIVIPAVVSLVVTLLILWIWDSQRPPDERVIVLPTTSGTSLIPPASVQPGGVTGSTTQIAGENTPSPGCENITHFVASGETLGAIARQYGLTPDDLTAMNQSLDPNFDPDFLSVGQAIVIPVCGIPTGTPIPPPTLTSVPTRSVPSPIATASQLPAGTVSVQIERVVNPGDITREAVEIINIGTPVDLEGWSLTAGGREEFIFPAFRLFTGGGVTVHSGAGQNSPIDLYWGLTSAIWQAGVTAFLYDADGNLQDEYDVTP